MVDRPNADFARAWYISYAMAALLTVPIDHWWGPWEGFAPWLAVFMLGFFCGAELVAGGTRAGESGTKTEFTHYRVKHPAVRFVLGVWLALLVMWRVPAPLGLVLGIALWFWLPLHFALWGIERKVWQWLKRRFKRG